MSYDRDKSKEQLITELERLRLENVELKKCDNNQREHLPIKEEDVQQKSWINFLSSRILLDSMQEVVTIKDLNGVHRASSSAMCDLIGKPESYIVGCTDFDLFPHEQATFYVEVDREVIEEQELKKVEEQVTGQHGSFWVQTTKSPLFDQSGECVGIIVVVRDITERKKAEQALRQSESYYRTIFETTGTAMCIFGPDTTISAVNSNFENISGYSKQEIEGKKYWIEFIHPEDLDWMQQNHHIALQDPDKAVNKYDFRCIVRNGEVRNVFMYADFIPGTNQTIASFIDITDRKCTEQILQARLRLMEHSLTHSFQEILTATVDEAESLTESRIGFYHFLHADQRTLSLQTWSTRTKTEACTAQVPKEHYDIDEAGVWVDCIHHGKSVIHNDYSALPHRKGTPQGHPTIVRQLVVPVYREGAIKALLGVGNKLGDYTNADVETVSLLANLAWDITERKQTEEALRESEERYRKLINTSPDAIALADERGRFLTVNPAMAQRFDHTQAELEGKTFYDVIDYELADKRIAYAKESIESNKLVYFEDERNGLHIQNYYVPIDTSDSPRTFQIIARDITERKQLEQTLRQERDRTQKYLDIAGVIFLALNTSGEVTLVNQKGSEILGYEQEEILGRDWFSQFLPERNKESLQSLFQSLISREIKPTEYFENTVVTHDGRERIVGWYNTILMDEQGNTTGTLSSGMDITEQKEAEEALKKSEERFRKLFNTAPDSVALVDEEGRFITVNPTMAKRFGLTPQELEGKTHHEVIPRDVADKRIEKGKEAVENEELIYFEDVRNGLHLENFYVPVSTSGKKRTFQVISRDITERKQLEQKLREISLYDSLTGLYNRNFFEEEMNRLSDGRHNPLGIIVCDLDGLKFVNDTLGHQAGDQMLIQTADILRQNFRSSDVIARIGGDEFATLLTETDTSMAEKVVQRLRQSVQEYNSADPEIPLSLSIGYALDEVRTADMQALFREADNRMYREKLQREGSARSAILQALTVSMEARDFNTENHCNRMQDLSASLARSLELSQEFINDLFLLARFHDLGKVGIPDHILFKPGPLTEEEWRQMRQHCEIGHRIASSVPDLEPIADFILKHHEWWDGRGYPHGLSGDDIPLPCRILAIVDAYDAMTSDRPYRNAMSRHDAVLELRRCAGTQFDPNLVEKFIQILD